MVVYVIIGKTSSLTFNLICLGFSPEAYVHIIFGFLMDKLHENAYPVMFVTMAAVMLFGALICMILRRGVVNHSVK